MRDRAHTDELTAADLAAGQVPPFLSPEEVAAALGTGTESVRRWCRAKEIPSVKHHRRLRIPGSWLVELARQAEARA